MKGDESKKNKVTALITSLLVHAALIAALFFIILPQIDQEAEGGILVNIGDSEFASGMFVPHQLEPDYQPSIPPAAPEPTKVEDQYLTQETPEAPTIKQEKVKEDKQKQEAERIREQQRIQEEQRRKREQEEASRREAIQKRVSGAFGNANNQKGSGDTPGAAPGRQGSPDGNVPSGGVNTGVGGFGGSFSLKGRQLTGGGLPRPSYDVQVEGTIVVEIVVSPEGRVITANIAPGTNIDNYSMRQGALEAARRARFNPVNEVNNQTGTITYRYRLN